MSAAGESGDHELEEVCVELERDDGTVVHLRDGQIVDELDAAEEIATAGDWADGAVLVFMCQGQRPVGAERVDCGRLQPCAPPNARGGITAGEARAAGWKIHDGLVLCPSCARRLDGEEVHQHQVEAPAASERAPRTRREWRGDHWASVAVDDEAKS